MSKPFEKLPLSKNLNVKLRRSILSIIKLTQIITESCCGFKKNIDKINNGSHWLVWKSRSQLSPLEPWLVAMAVDSVSHVSRETGLVIYCILILVNHVLVNVLTQTHAILPIIEHVSSVARITTASSKTESLESTNCFLNHNSARPLI